MSRSAGLVTALALMTAAPGFAQQLAVSRTVLLTVADPQDRPVVDLLPDDFVVEEGGQPREVLDVRLADYPVALLVDNGVAARGDYDQLHAAAERFINRLGARPILLGRLSNPPALLTEFGDDHDAVLAALQQLSTAPGGSSVMLGIEAAAEVLANGGFPFTAIVALSADPADTGVAVPGQIMRFLTDSHATLYIIARRQGLRDRTSADLLSLADQSGGRFTRIFSSASYEPAIDEITGRLTTELMVQFLEPPDASPSDDVRVGVRLAGARVTGLGITPP
jgi:hypothetical protein